MKEKQEFEDVSGKPAQLANELLKEIGEGILSVQPWREHGKYLGSAAVHIYKTDRLDSIFYICQVDGVLGTATEGMASSAFTALQNKLMSYFGRKERR